MLSISFAVLLSSHVGALGPTPVSWTAATSSTWGQASRWTPAVVPDNGSPPGSTYVATIDVGGGPYFVSVVAPRTVDAVHVDSSDATLQIISVLTADQIDLDAGTLRMGGGIVENATITVNGGSISATSAPTNEFRNVTIDGDLVLPNDASLGATGGLTVLGQFYSGVDSEITVDTDLDVEGTLQVRSGATLTVGGATIAPQFNVFGDLQSGSIDVTTGFVQSNGAATSSGDASFDALTIQSFASLSVEGVLDIASSITLLQSSNLGLGSTQTLDFDLTIDENAAISFFTPGTTMTNPAGRTLTARLGSMSAPGAGDRFLVNEGTIDAQIAPGDAFAIDPKIRLSNSGAINVSGGGILGLNGMSGDVGTLSVEGESSVFLDGTYTVNETITVDASTLALRGTWANTASIDLIDATLLVEGTPTRIGTITGTGDIVVTADIDNTGSTLFIPGAGPVMTFSSANISGGTIDATNPMRIVEGQGEVSRFLDGVAADGVIRIEEEGELMVDASASIAGQVTLDADAKLLFPGNQSIDGFDITFLPGSTTDSVIGADDDSVLVLGKDMMLRVREGVLGGSSSFADPRIISEATILLDGSGTFFITPREFYNHGTIDVADETGTIVLAPDVLTINRGSIDVTGGDLSIASAFEQDGGSINQTGGEVILTGDLLNDGALITLDGPAAVWTLDFGDIRGGTIAIRNGATLRTIGNNGIGTLWDVTIDGDLRMEGSFRNLNLEDGVEMVQGDIYLHDNADLRCGGLDQTGIFTLDGATTVHITDESTGGPVLRPWHDTIVVVGEDVVIRGGDQRGDAGIAADEGSGLTNFGRISADIPGYTLLVKSSTLRNENIIEATNGATLHVHHDSETVNNGVLRADGGIFALEGTTTASDLGEIDASNGTFVLGAIVDLEGHTLTFDATTGSPFVCYPGYGNGRISNGTIELLDGQVLRLQGDLGRLDDCLVIGDVEVFQFGRLRLYNTSDVSGSVLLLEDRADVTFLANATSTSGNYIFVGEGSERAIGVATAQDEFVFKEDAVVRGGDGTLRANTGVSVIQRGTISSDDDGLIMLRADAFLNEGTIEATGGGRLDFGGPPAQGLPGAFVNAGLLDLSEGNDFPVDGTFEQTGGGTIHLAVLGPADASSIVATEAMTIGGSIVVDIAKGVELAPGQSIVLMQGATLDGTFADVTINETTPRRHRLAVQGNTVVLQRITPGGISSGGEQDPISP